MVDDQSISNEKRKKPVFFTNIQCISMMILFTSLKSYHILLHHTYTYTTRNARFKKYLQTNRVCVWMNVLDCAPYFIHFHSIQRNQQQILWPSCFAFKKKKKTIFVLKPKKRASKDYRTLPSSRFENIVGLMVFQMFLVVDYLPWLMDESSKSK